MSGDARRQRAEWDPALIHFARALALQERTRDVALGGGLLDCVAGVAAALRSAPTAATLLGAGDSWRELHGLHRIPTVQPAHDRDVARARRQLGPDASQPPTVRAVGCRRRTRRRNFAGPSPTSSRASTSDQPA